MRVCVIGLGKLGAVMAAVFADSGHQVVGYDINEDSVLKLGTGIAPVEETGLQELITKNADHISATTDLVKAVDSTDIAFIIVPTPSNRWGEFDSSLVESVATQIGDALQDNDHPYTVVVSSTVMPGTCAQKVQPRLNAAAGHHVPLCYSPEFIALGSVIIDMRNPDMVLVGCDGIEGGDVLEEVLKPVVWSNPTFVWLSLMDAELAKISVNSYVTMKISFANQLAAICERMPGANATSVLSAVGFDHRIGLFYLRPGGPFGGPCFPRDNKAFQRIARNVEVDAPLARATDDVNSRIVDRIIAMLDDTGSIAVLGLSYKPNTSVTEESFGTKLVEKLLATGREVDFHDPAVSDESAQALLKRSRQAIIATAHDEYRKLDYSRLDTVIDVWSLVPDGDNVQTIGLGPDE